VELVNAESHCPRPQNLDAVDLTMRGWALLWQKPTRETDRTARDLFEQAVKLDPTNAEAYTGLAYSHARDFANGWPDPGADYAAFGDQARRSGACDQSRKWHGGLRQRTLPYAGGPVRRGENHRGGGVATQSESRPCGRI